MNNGYLSYLQEISANTSWVSEVIARHFDGAVDMLTKNAVIYGSVVRDCLAGKELFSNLSIAVPFPTESNILIDKFVKSPKWAQLNNVNKESLYFDTIPPTIQKQQSHLVAKIPQTLSFKTFGDKTVQIVTPNTVNNDPFNTIINFVRKVDIVCCGVMLTYNNKILEVVYNAYEDCKNGVLNLNTKNTVNNLSDLKQYVDKLCNHGWISKINMLKIEKAIERRSKRKANYEKIKGTPPVSKGEWLRATTNKSDNSYKRQHNYLKRFNYTSTKKDEIQNTARINKFVLSAQETKLFGGESEVMGILDGLANQYKMDIVVEKTKFSIVYMTKDLSTGLRLSDQIKKIKMHKQLKNSRLSSVKPLEQSTMWSKLL